MRKINARADVTLAPLFTAAATLLIMLNGFFGEESTVCCQVCFRIACGLFALLDIQIISVIQYRTQHFGIICFEKGKRHTMDVEYTTECVIILK